MLVLFVVLLSILSTSFSSLNIGTTKKFKYIETDKCTSIAAGSKAMIDGSTVTTHNNDCQECDFRITHVPARNWPSGSKRPVYGIRNAYPRYIENSEDSNIHGPDYARTLHYPDTKIYNWANDTTIIGFIDQIPHTYGYTLGTYAIQNEKQVSIGESTCSSKFVAKPVFAEGGHALMHMETLTEIALERCDTARCAIETMGALAVQHGFYGPEWQVHDENAEDESGEALTVSDKNEAWMFHVMPDDSGASAIWVAQRVPDDHITVVANQFVIGEINVEDSANYLASANIFAAAERSGLWSASTGIPFHFSRVYGNDRSATGFMCTRRMWRVFTLAAPSLKKVLSPFTNGLATFGYGEDLSQPYPFSVKVDKPLSLQDIFNMNRDQFEGTLFDLTTGIDSGMFGDPMRFGPIPDWLDKDNGLSWDSFKAGVGFERPISLWRTAYSSVTQSRKNFPNEVGAVAWIAQYAPHHSTFTPVYASADKTPSVLNTGTQYKLDKKSNWWIHCLTGNYLSRWYKYTIKDVKKFQQELEAILFSSQVEMEREAIVIATVAAGKRKLIGEPRKKHHHEPAVDNDDASDTPVPPTDTIDVPALPDATEPITIGKYLTEYHESMGQMINSEWWDFFFKMAGTYRDMYKVTNPHAEDFARSFKYVGVPKWWFESIGYWGAPGVPATGADGVPDKPSTIRRYTFPTERTVEDYKTKYPTDFSNAYAFYGYNATFSFYGDNESPYDPLVAGANPLDSAWYSSLMSTVIGVLIGIAMTLVYLRLVSGSRVAELLPGGKYTGYTALR